MAGKYRVPVQTTSTIQQLISEMVLRYLRENPQPNSERNEASAVFQVALEAGDPKPDRKMLIEFNITLRELAEWPKGMLPSSGVQGQPNIENPTSAVTLPTEGSELSKHKPNTLGYHRVMARAVFGADSKAVKWLDKKIAEAPGGEAEPVVAHESQVVYLLGQINLGKLDEDAAKL